MRSAEISDAGANGFGASKNTADNRRSDDKGQAPDRRSLPFRASPITAAVALTSLLAATLFVIYDTARTFDDTRRALAMIGATLVSEITELAPEAVNFVANSSSPHLGNAARAGLDSPWILSTPPSTPTAPLGLLGLETEHAAAWIGIAQRGAAAAALLTLLTWRRRQGGGLPDILQRHNYGMPASAIPTGVACWTKTGDLVVCSDQYRDRVNLTSSAVTFHEAVKKLIVGGHMTLLNEDENNRLLELHREDGSCWLIDERPLADGGFLTLLSDATERKKVDTMLRAIREEQRLLARRYHEEKLKAEATSRSKTNFLAHLSHDIRTPLNHIIGFAELMRHQTYGPLGDARYDDYVQSIKASGEHLLASFATILDLAELESGQKAMRSDPVGLDELLDSLAQRFRAQAGRAEVALVRGEPSGAVLRGDRLGLNRMLTNIVENSLRFTPAGGRITIAAFTARDGVVIEVTDTGLGMDEERLASLSQPFALGDATFTREGVGRGLGISISRAIAELSGGHMTIDSSPALGTTVAISLPLQAEPVLQAAE